MRSRTVITSAGASAFRVGDTVNVDSTAYVVMDATATTLTVKANRWYWRVLAWWRRLGGPRRLVVGYGVALVLAALAGAAWGWWR